MDAIADPTPRSGGRRALIASAALAVTGLALTSIAIATAPRRALLGYLFAYATVVSVAAGALVLLLVGYATNARWLAPLRRLQEAITVSLPVLAILFVPIALGVPYIYAWADPAVAWDPHERHLLDAKRGWLEPAAFVIRSALYLAVFVIAGEVLRRWSRRRDGMSPATLAEVDMGRERKFASAMIAPVGLALTFAAFDWVMSLQPLWTSTMFGVYYFAGGFVAGIAVLALLAWRQVATRVDSPLTRHHFHAIGRMLFAFVVFWAYASYFQGFLIQIANRPIEVTFFLARLHGGWDVVLWAVVIARFVVPFVLLLPRSVKLRPGYVAAVAVIVLAGHVLDMFWLVIPSARSSLSIDLADVAALAGIGGACATVAAWRQRGVPLAATGDPFLAPGSAYESPT